MTTRQEQDTPENMYPLPLYLNQKYVFDMLAMMEEGLSQLQNVKTTQTDQQDASRRYSGDVGVKNVFSFLGVSLGAERASKKQRNEMQEITTERVYTPNALFARMREWLYEDCPIVRSELSNTKPGAFVEFEVTLRKNPLIETLETFLSLMQMALVFQEPQQPKPKPTSQQQGRGQKPSVAQGPGEDEGDKVMRQMRGFLDQLNAQGSLDLVGTVTNQEGMQVVLTLDKAFLSDPSLSDLVDGQYTVLGKVVRVLPKGSEEKLNLLRKTGLGKIQTQLLQEMTAKLQGAEGAGFKIPDLAMEIEAPAIQVMPIAIFA
jgi:hypothetical protein